MSRRAWAAAVALGAAVLAGCGTEPDAGSAATSSAATEPSLSGTLTVLAAASLQEVLTAVADEVEAANPGVEVDVAFGASSTLADQLVQGAPGDVLATASPATMRRAADAGVVGDPVVFARNTVALAVPAANPAGIDDVADLAATGVKLAMCEPEVPCGVVGAELLDRAGLDVEPVTLEPDVRAVLQKVSLGEVDAGLVYATDVKAAADDVSAVPLPEELLVSTDYPVAIATDAAQPELAEELMSVLTGPSGRELLEQAGFAVP